MEKLPVMQTVRDAWGLYKQHAAKLSGIFLLVIVLNFALQYLPAWVAVSSDGEATVAQASLAAQLLLVSFFIQSYLMMGWVRVSLKVAKGEQWLVKDLFPHALSFVKYEITSWILMVIVMVGLILLIVPGLLFSLMFSQALNLIIDKNSGVFQSLGESRRLMKGNWGAYSLLITVTVGINLLGALLLGLGLLVTVPLTAVTFAKAYTVLQSRATLTQSSS